MVNMKMIAREETKRILAHYLELVKQNYEDISPENEIVVGSFLTSEESQKTEANNTVQFSIA